MSELSHRMMINCKFNVQMQDKGKKTCSQNVTC